MQMIINKPESGKRKKVRKVEGFQAEKWGYVELYDYIEIVDFGHKSKGEIRERDDILIEASRKDAKKSKLRLDEEAILIPDEYFDKNKHLMRLDKIALELFKDCRYKIEIGERANYLAYEIYVQDIYPGIDVVQVSLPNFKNLKNDYKPKFVDRLLYGRLFKQLAAQNKKHKFSEDELCMKIIFKKKNDNERTELFLPMSDNHEVIPNALKGSAYHLLKFTYKYRYGQIENDKGRMTSQSHDTSFIEVQYAGLYNFKSHLINGIKQAIEERTK